MTNLPDHIERDQRILLAYHQGQVDNLRKSIASAEYDIAHPAHGDTERDCRILIAKWEAMLPTELARVDDCLRNLGELPEAQPEIAAPSDVPAVAAEPEKGDAE